MSELKKADLYCYVIPTIYDFDGLVTVENFLSRRTEDSRELRQELSLAMLVAMEFMWEGDIDEGPCIFHFPGEDGDSHLKHAFIFRQSNDGMTFVVSKERMPWLQPCRDGNRICVSFKLEGA